jgi:hypothetical protein
MRYLSGAMRKAAHGVHIPHLHDIYSALWYLGRLLQDSS